MEQLIRLKQHKLRNLDQGKQDIAPVHKEG
jgi:hypothetical protein